MTPTAPVYLALVHHPVLNKQGDVITTAVTNLDIHDGSRISATYNLARYYIITPLYEQISLVHRIRSHWVDGSGATKTPTRGKALEKLVAARSLKEAYDEIMEEQGRPPVLIGTSARPKAHQHITYEALRQRIYTETQPFFIILGTGWGLAEEALEPKIDFYLPPIKGPSDYNHLSVRAAMAITIDRLLRA